MKELKKKCDNCNYYIQGYNYCSKQNCEKNESSICSEYTQKIPRSLEELLMDIIDLCEIYY